MVVIFFFAIYVHLSGLQRPWSGWAWSSCPCQWASFYKVSQKSGPQHVRQSIFLSPYDKTKSYSWKTETTAAMYCMQRPGKSEGIAGAACLLNKISRGSHARSQDKKIFQQPSLSVWSWGQGRGAGFSLNWKSSSCFKWAGVKQSTLLCLRDLTVPDQEVWQLHFSRNGLWSRKNRQHRPVVAWYFSSNPSPDFWCIGVSRTSDHKCPFSILV